MRDLLWALSTGAMLALVALLVTGAAAGEYHDVDSAAARVSTLADAA